MNKNNWLARSSRLGVIILLVAMPFHALLTTWVGSNYGHLLVWRGWKEVLLALLTIGALYLFCTNTELRSAIWSRMLNKLIAIYAVWLMVTSILIARDPDAFVQGLAIDLRFLLFFVLVQIAFFYKPLQRGTLLKIILIPSVFVVVFGLLQMFVLPRTFLEWFGYDKDATIPPFFTVDEQLSNVRFMSTLSGPNTLGAYLVLPIMMVIGSFKSFFGKGLKYLSYLPAIFYLLAASIVLYATQSRSAWIAMILACCVYIFFRLPQKLRAAALGVGVFSVVVAGLFTYHYQDTQFVQDVILHDDQKEGGEVSSNGARLGAYQNAVKDIQQRPLLGCGVGCAGPASVRHEGGVKIAENYYLQVAQEAGVIGMILLLTIIFFVGKELYQKRKDNLHLALLASLVGLSVANLLLHTWADDTLAYLWWGVAALVLFSLQDHSDSAVASAKHPRTSA